MIGLCDARKPRGPCVKRSAKVKVVDDAPLPLMAPELPVEHGDRYGGRWYGGIIPAMKRKNGKWVCARPKQRRRTYYSPYSQRRR